MSTHEEYVTYAQAVALKELGFDWPCECHYAKEDAPDDCVWIANSGQYPTNSLLKDIGGERTTAPTQAVACRWLREEKGIYIHPLVNKYNINQWRPFLVRYNKRTEESWVSDFPTYEAALSAGIDRAIELLKGCEKCGCR